MKKSELFSAWLVKSEEIAASLNLDLSFGGIDTASDPSLPQQYEPIADKPYLKADVIFGEEDRPYLNGLDGQHYNAIIQIAAHYPKMQQYQCLSVAESVADSVALDSIVGLPVFNKQISPVIFTEDRVVYVVSFTVKSV
jgi:hypothetical protein